MLSTNTGSFTSFFPIYLPFDSFSCLKSDHQQYVKEMRADILNMVLDLKEKMLSILSLSIM